MTLSPAATAELDRLGLASPFARRVCDRHPDWTAACFAGDGFDAPPAETVASRLASMLAGADDEASFMSALRIFRNREMARIAFRDVLRAAPLDETLQALSALGDAAIDTTLRQAETALQLRHGVPRSDNGQVARPIVIGMGKLGGEELNFSSDVDLIFAYTASGDTDGPQPLSNEEYFGKLTREIGRLLSTVTADGFVFRVDLALRPFGSVGAWAMPAMAFELYYQNQGRDWERYALVKARPVAGDKAAGKALLHRLQPFVFRRYLDYNALGYLRELKGMIDRDAAQRGAENDLKIGSGGIRELEFIVQLFQLIRGGDDSQLRDRRLRPTLKVLKLRGLLAAETVDALDADYVFCGVAKTPSQMYADQQTHRVPAAEETAGGDGGGAGFLPTGLKLEAELGRVRSHVADNFAAVYAEGATGSRDGATLTLFEADADALRLLLAGAGVSENTEEIARSIVQLRDGRLARSLSVAGRKRLTGIVEQLILKAKQQPDPARALIRALNVLGAIAGRSAYLALLHERPMACDQLIRLAGASPWLAELIAQTPALLDVLLSPTLGRDAPGRDELQEALAAQLAALPLADTESVMDLLRRYRQSMMLRIAAADLSGALPLVDVSNHLTWLAETIVIAAVEHCRRLLVEALGEASNADGSPAGFAVLAYGKFGSFELGYGSDLDIVFVYDTDAPDAPTRGGARSVSNAEMLLRLAQRVVQMLSAQTASGRAYEVDLELRPNGNSGLVVTSLAGFSGYQREHAWTWEHQALLRARPVAGSRALREALAELRHEVLTRPIDPQKLRSDVIAMRQRMRDALGRPRQGQWNLKQAVGGLIDAEFITQYLCLKYAATHPALIDFTDNWRQLELLERDGLITPADAQALLAAERRYRGVLHRTALQRESAFIDNDQMQVERETVTALWRKWVEEGERLQS